MGACVKVNSKMLSCLAKAMTAKMDYNINVDFVDKSIIA